MNEHLVSIIVAVHNAEQYLPRCLNSVLNQTYRNIEVIVIDDASTDNTLSLIEDYAARDSRISVLRMERNSGAPAARNKGKAIATGKYLTTVDADDALGTDAIELAVKELDEDPELDIVTYSLIRVFQDTGKEVPFKINPKVPSETLTGTEACYWSLQWDIPGFSVTRSPLEKDIPEEDAYGQYGDETSTHLVFLKSRKVKLGKGKYYYYQIDTSYTKKISIKRFDILECRLSLKRHLTELGVSHDMIKRLEVKRWRDLIGACHLYWEYGKTFSTDDRNKIWTRLHKNYSTFHFNELPIQEILRPRFVMMPTFRLFYWQLKIIFSLGLIHIR